ncbi:MAG: J domain-containing protein [Alphaproteobacteria bacterium]|nr:J domain-containing protein [Alphaproteobacteria bacterium]
MRDPYDILGVGNGASEADIKRAYRKIAKETHPDTHPGDEAVEQRFKEAAAAYDLLSDKEKRGQFDRGEIDAEGKPKADFAFNRAYSGGGGGFGFGGGSAGMEDVFSDLFGGMRGGRRGGMGSIPGADVRYTVRIDFLSAVKGVRRRINRHDGKTLDVNIPPGTEDGQSLRLKGQGLQGKGGGPAGDAFVEVQVDAHPFFTRDKSDIEVELPISIDEAVLGAKIKVPTVDGPVSVTVPPNTSSGTRLRLKGRGVPASRPSGTPGDQYVRLKIVLPEQSDEELEEFFRQWGEKNPSDVRRKAGME